MGDLLNYDDGVFFEWIDRIAQSCVMMDAME